MSGAVLLDLGIDDALSACDVQPDEGVTDLPGCVKLWRAVVAAAAAEALSPVPSPQREAARRYLTTPSADLEMILDFAGFDRAAMLERTREMAARDWRPLRPLGWGRRAAG
jgi:hypothetical protein